MTILVSPAEPAEFASLGDRSRLVEDQYGSDFLVAGRGFLVAVQRKTFPGDFLASVADGRFPILLPRMLNAEFRVLLLEGRPTWTSTGALLNFDWGAGRQFTRTHLRGMLWSLQWVWGVHTMWTDDTFDTLDFLRDLRRWAEKDRHDALGVRPGPDKGPWKRQAKPRDRAVHLLQGFEGIGLTTAEAIFDHFEHLPLRWSVTEKDLQAVPGVGPGRVSNLTRLVPAAEPVVPVDTTTETVVSGGT